MTETQIPMSDAGDAHGWFSQPLLLAQNNASPSASPLMMGGNESSTTTTQPAAGTQGAPGGAGGAGGAKPQPQGLGPIIWLLPLVLLFFIIMSGSSQRKEKKRMQGLLSNLKKQDRVLTIGGLIGTVVELRDDEVVLKVDENANTRVRFTKSSIQQVLRPADAAPPAGGAEPKVEVRAGKGEKAAV